MTGRAAAVLVKLSVLGVLAVGACAEGGDAVATLDASLRSDAATTTAADFNHFRFEIAPDVPLQDRLFAVVVTAYSSVDDSEQMSSYSSTLSMTASVGNLSGDAAGIVLSNGTATFNVMIDASGSDVVLTVVDEVVSTIAGSSDPFYVSAPGDTANALAVVINEINWFGNDLASTDEWIEIRNVSGGELNLSEWTLEGAGTSDEPIVTFNNGTLLADGEYLLLARLQGADVDGQRSALTGLVGVQIHDIELADGGEHLVLRDVESGFVDETPDSSWPAGSNINHYSMERRDEMRGGYGDGALDGAWYTWSSIDGESTTSVDSTDLGTPGASNSDPDRFDHFTITLSPARPVVGQDFVVSVQAHGSADESVPLTGYNGSISISKTGAGTLSGDVLSQSITSGSASLTLQLDQVAPSIVLTVTDDVYPAINGQSVEFAVIDTGDTAVALAVVISEVNWFGNAGSTFDEWVELRNISGASLDISGWSVDGLGTGSDPLLIASNTVLADGAYLVLGDRQGADVDGSRTSLTGVSGVQVNSALALSNGGDSLSLRDISGTLIDQTPAGAWPAGDPAAGHSMERQDALTGGGYGDGSQALAWYTWNPLAGVDSTSVDSSDHGTPGADNSDPNAVLPPLALPYATGFEVGDAAFENLGSGTFTNLPPLGTSARSGTGIAATDSVTTAFSGRQLQTVDCLVLNDDTSIVNASAFATASTNNGGNALRGRIKLLWFIDSSCATPDATTPDTSTASALLPQGVYSAFTIASVPPAGATHLKLGFEIRDDNGLPNTEDDFALDDVAVTQP